MKNSWQDKDARAFVARYPSIHEDLALRLYSSRLIGAEPGLVLHGGGNTSVKGELETLLGDRVRCLWVKGSGSSLDRVEPKDFPALDLSYLERLRALGGLTDEEMVNQLRTHLYDASAPNPSVEALLHAFLPHKFVDHSHADAVLALSDQPDGDARVREALGARVAVLPYIMPGFPLAKAVAEVYEADPSVIGVVLHKHGLFTFGASAEESYSRHIELVDACERYAEKHARHSIAVPSGPPANLESAWRGAAALGPTLRGLLAGGQRDAELVMEHRVSREILTACASPALASWAATGPLTPDHVIRVKPWPLVLSEASGLSGPIEGAARDALAAAVSAYRARYEAYVVAGEAALGPRKRLDAAPRVVLVPGVGVLAFGKTKKDARIAADISERTLDVKQRAQAMSGFQALPDADLFAMEYWSLEQAKLGKESPRALDRRVVLITGGAGAIGRGVAESCAQAGAHVVLVDRDAEAVSAAAAELEARFGAGVAVGVTADVTDPTAVSQAFERAAASYGGVDVVVANAGIALVRSIEELTGDEALRVMEVNYLGVLHTLRAATSLFKAQGLGGDVIVNASKNVFAPGKDFAAYSASKAAAHQLAKIAAMELAPIDVRVNSINADAVFAHGDTKSGLWAEVGPSRAKSRGLSLPELEDFYRKRNLLSARVEARHVGNAVVFFASRQTPTTGATLPVDGGIPEAFPR